MFAAFCAPGGKLTSFGWLLVVTLVCAPVVHSNFCDCMVEPYNRNKALFDQLLSSNASVDVEEFVKLTLH